MASPKLRNRYSSSIAVSYRRSPAVADERVDHHQQRGARHVEVGHQQIDDLPVVGPVDEQPGPALRAAPNVAALSSARTLVVPTATTRRACPAAVEHVGAHAVALAVDLVVARVVGADRLERVETDDQLDTADSTPARLELRQQLGREVQTRGRRGRRRRARPRTRSGTDPAARVASVMYGGSGISPCAASSVERVALAEDLRRRCVSPASVRAPISTSSTPGRGRAAARRARSFRAGRTIASQRRRSSSSGSSSSTSAAPPLCRCSRSRAGITFESLTTSRSPSRSSSIRSRTCRCPAGPLPRSTSRRALSRGSIGTWAMRSPGSW